MRFESPKCVWICTNSHCTILTPISVLKTLRQPHIPPAPPPPLIGWPTEVAMEICVVGQACEMKGADFEWPNPLWYNFICTQTQISDHAILVCMQWCSQTNKSQFLLLVSSWWYRASSDLYWEGDLCWPRHEQWKTKHFCLYDLFVEWCNFNLSCYNSRKYLDSAWHPVITMHLYCV